jgi:ankyrin repeat protein
LGTPIHFAIKKQFSDPNLIKKMINKGIDPNSTDLYGCTTLLSAFMCFNKDRDKYEQICDILLQNGCNPNLRDLQGMTCLLVAAKRNDKSAIKYAI